MCTVWSSAIIRHLAYVLGVQNVLLDCFAQAFIVYSKDIQGGDKYILKQKLEVGFSFT